MSLEVDPTGLNEPQNPIGLPTLDDILGLEPAPEPEPAAVAPVAAPEPVVAPPVATQTPAVETPPAATVAAPPPPAAALPPELATLMARLAEKEQLLDRQLQEAQAAVERYRPLERFAGIEQRLHEQDVFGALEQLGVQPKALQEAMQRGGGVSPTRAIEQRFEQKLKSIESAYEQRLAAIEQANYAQQQQAARAEIQAEVTARSPVIASLGPKGVDLVWGALEQHYKRTGQVATYETVIGEVEKQYREHLEGALRNETIRKALKLEEAAPAQPAAPAAPKTLTNAMTPVTQRTPPKALPEDREARIAAILAE